VDGGHVGLQGVVGTRVMVMVVNELWLVSHPAEHARFHEAALYNTESWCQLLAEGASRPAAHTRVTGYNLSSCWWHDLVVETCPTSSSVR
jgi:hypothetical protein